MDGSQLWSLGMWAGAALFGGLYWRGAVRLRRRGTTFADARRVLLFVAAVALIASALAWPLHPLSRQHLLARTGQMLVVCLLGAPLFWLALPVHVLVAALPAPWRRRATWLLFRRSGWTPTLQAATGPVAAWFVYIAAFLLWHDPGFVALEMASVGRQRAAGLSLLLAALLFWQQVTLGGPRQYATAGAAARIAMLVGAWIPNVVAGITIAFGSTLFYGPYESAGLNPVAVVGEQSFGGALIWVLGSLVYFGAIVGVANELFERTGSRAPQSLPHWDDAEKFIAPGLEARLDERGYVPHNWRD